MNRWRHEPRHTHDALRNTLAKAFAAYRADGRDIVDFWKRLTYGNTFQSDHLPSLSDSIEDWRQKQR